MERVMIFIDGSNFYHGLKNNSCNPKIDFSKLASLLCDGRKLIRTYYYNAVAKQEDDPSRYKDQQRFFESLRNTPYLTVKFGRLEKRGSTFVEKGVDINIAVDMLSAAYSDAYDTAILITSDGDFVSAVEAVKDRGKHVENAYFKKGQSRHLRQTCDKFFLLNECTLRECFL